MWGYSAFTQCASAFDKRVPTLVPTVSSIKERIKFSLGGWHSLLLTEHGIYGWGHNDDGRCGIPIRDHLKTPTLIDFPELFIDVVAAAYHSVALTVTNRVVAWGTDYYLTIGNSDTRQDAYSPVYVDFFRGMVVQRIFSSSEAQASMAISNGVVYAWGNNNGGLFTAGTGNTRPTEVKGVNGFNIGNISLLDGRYYVIYATPLDQIYARITKIDKFYDVIVECSKH
jgi:alpha-tubulin suppressor-like RCC1 family protein